MEQIPLEEFNSALKEAMNDPSDLRVGQLLFTLLWEKYPKIIENVVCTDADPFMLDENIYNLMKKIVKNFDS